MTDLGILESLKGIDHLREHGRKKGLLLGIENLDQYINFIFPNVLYIYGSPQSGKSQFNNWMHVQLCKQTGQKALMYTPESTTQVDAYGDLVEYFTNKPIKETSDNEYKESIKWIKKHIDVITKNQSLDEIYKRFAGEDYRMLSLDTWLSVNHYREPDHHYLNKELPRFAEINQERKSHGTIVNHVNEGTINLKTEKGINGEDIQYYGKVTSAMLAGGQAWKRHGYNMLNFWLPPNGLLDAYGEPFKNGVVFAYIDKVKPRQAGKKEEHKGIPIYWWEEKRMYHDYKFNRLQYLEERNETILNDFKVKPLEPNTDFLNDKAPF